MSIIYDALKKVERSYDAKAGAKKEEKHPKFVFKKIYFLYLLLIGISVVAGRFFFTKAPPQHVEPAQVQPVEVQAPPQVQAPAPVPAPQEAQAPAPPIDAKKKLEESLVLNGIFFSGDEGCALINNQIVKQGDLIEGATVKQISLNEVELEFEGSTIKLYGKK